jgi:aryl-alcohol dehydrogenase-like predicted oxidoreductase
MEPGADRGLAPARIRRQLESTLERLGVESLDLYLTHHPDADTPLERTLDGLDALVAEGLVGAYGGCHLTAELLRAADGRYAWVQNAYSLLERSDERDVLPLAAGLGLGYTPFSPLAGGWLTGKYRHGAPPPEGSRMTLRPEPYQHLQTDTIFDGLHALSNHARERGITPGALALAWVLAQPRVDAAIIGSRRPSHLDDAVAALDVHVTDPEANELARLFVR